MNYDRQRKSILKKSQSFNYDQDIILNSLVHKVSNDTIERKRTSLSTNEENKFADNYLFTHNQH